MRRSGSLRRRILLTVLGYVFVLSAAVMVHGVVVNEAAEQLVWEALLDSELDHYLHRSRAERDDEWRDSASMRLFDPARPRRCNPWGRASMTKSRSTDACTWCWCAWSTAGA